MKIQLNTVYNKSFQNKPLNKKVSFGSKNKKSEIVKSTDLASTPFVKKTTVIPPKAFLLKSFRDYEPTISENEKQENFSEKINNYQQIKKEFNPKILRIIDKKITAYKISNFDYPYGSIAISTTLNDKISTGELIYCAGAAFVDKKHNLQTLLHFCPTISKKENEELLKYILSFTKPENLEVTIVPGDYEDTEYSVNYLYNKIKELSKGANICFANFPDKQNTTLVLNQGKLFCTKGSNISGSTNPKNKIINASLDPIVKHLN